MILYPFSSIRSSLSSTYAGALLSLFIATITFFLLRLRLKNSNQLPLSPPGLPFIGHLHQLGSLPHRSLKSLSEKYGEVMLLYFGNVRTVIINSAPAAQEVMKTHNQAFANRPKLSTAVRLFYDGKGLGFAKYGEYWRQVRQIYVLHLLSLKRVKSFRSVRQEEVSLFLDKIRGAATAGPVVNVSEMIITLVSDIVCRTALGKKHFPVEEGGGRKSSTSVRDLILEFVALLGVFPMRDLFPWLGWIDSWTGLDARVRKTAVKADAFLEKVLQEHLDNKRNENEEDHAEHNSSSNFLDILLSLNNEKSDTTSGGNFSIGRDNVKALILDIFVGGTATTYTTMEWAMAELVNHPEEMKRVQEEVRLVAGETNGIIVGEEAVGGMKYLQAVIKETLRLHPPGPLLLPRESLKDTIVQGYHIPAGTRVMINAWAIGRDPRSWEKPDEFWPERFLNSSIDFKGQDFQLIPFGAGQRGCPAINFAISTVGLALANLLYHFEWELPPGLQGKALDMTEAFGAAVHRKSSLVLVAKSPRNF